MVNRGALLAVVWLGAVATLLPVPVASAPAENAPTLLDFELEDQFGEVYRRDDYAGRVICLIGSGSEGSRFNGSWSEAIQRPLEREGLLDRVVFLPHADLGSVPRLLRGFIKGKFPKERERWVMMDWKGSFDKAYGFAPKSSNILVFDAEGRLVHHAHGREVDPDVVDGILAALRPLL